jgi:DNA modification methylase
MKTNLIYNKDCLEFMRKMNNKCVDFVFYDPPYNVGKDYGNYQDNLPTNEYYDFMLNVAAHSRRISKSGISVFVPSNLNCMMYEILPDAHLLPIHKRAAGVRKNNYALQYFSLFVIGNPVIKCRDLWDDVRLPGEGYFFKEERFGNPGQTSQALVKKILHHFTNKNDVIFDPFMGVGTTALAALSMDRKFIGCELNKEYIRIAETRINALEWTIK